MTHSPARPAKRRAKANSRIVGGAGLGRVALQGLGAAEARRIHPKHVGQFVLLVAWGMTLYFVYTTYRAT
jgi:hypothetical protein